MKEHIKSSREKKKVLESRPEETTAKETETQEDGNSEREVRRCRRLNDVSIIYCCLTSYLKTVAYTNTGIFLIL